MSLLQANLPQDPLESINDAGASTPGWVIHGFALSRGAQHG